MSELPNLTDRISHLRDRKTSSLIIQGDPDREQKSQPKKQSAPRERRFSTDYFMLFVYALLAVAVLSQFALILWLDLI
jgi:hypothetical protein